MVYKHERIAREFRQETKFPEAQDLYSRCIGEPIPWLSLFSGASFYTPFGEAQILGTLAVYKNRYMALSFEQNHEALSDAVIKLIGKRGVGFIERESLGLGDEAYDFLYGKRAEFALRRIHRQVGDQAVLTHLVSKGMDFDSARELIEVYHNLDEKTLRERFEKDDIPFFRHFTEPLKK